MNTPDIIREDNKLYTYLKINGSDVYSVYEYDTLVKTIFRISGNITRVDVTEQNELIEKAVIENDKYIDTHSIYKDYSLQVNYSNGLPTLIVISEQGIDNIVFTKDKIVQGGISNVTDDPDYIRTKEVIKIAEHNRLMELLDIRDDVLRHY